MTAANSDFNKDPYKTTDAAPEDPMAIEGGQTSALVYSPQMNEEIMRELAEVNALVLAKVESLSPEKQAQFHALIEQGKLIEANGHLDS